MLVNIIGYNIIWFGLVYWGNLFMPISLLLLTAHLYFVAKGHGELKLIFMITLIGFFVDSLLQYFSVFVFTSPNHIPYWLIMLWACFGATICHSLRFLDGSRVLQAIVGGLFAPLSYIAGYKLQAVNFGYSLIITYVVLSVIWAMLFVLFYSFKSHWVTNGVNVEVSHA